MRRIITSVLLAILLVAVFVLPVLADYYAEITVTESNATSYTQLALNYSMNVTHLVSDNYITSTGLDTRVVDEEYYVQPHLLADDRLLWVADITASSENDFMFLTGYEALTSFPTITGHGGYVTVTDHSDLELGTVYAIAVVGYVDTATGANKNIIRKDNVVLLSVTDTSEITYAITGGNSLVATSVSSGAMTIVIYSDGVEVWMEIDDVEQDRDNASAVPNTSDNWVLFENDVMPYVTYFGIWVA